MIRSTTLNRIALVIASGIALALAFPKFDISLMAWVAFVPLLYAINDLSYRAVFGYAWLQGIVFYTASLYWIVITLHSFARVPLPIAVLPLLLAAAVAGLFTGFSVLSSDYVA